ncbi:hypothetical protein MKQ70_14980 [Chitinophaga sedimenti]|uniref:hypothetical protein n=1 Tax=Chitinophaga sedimenti TaxID=2033606 RepID=UPI002004D36F|nr:hypothetical protein [Chitinophaga sedimenti]MCK7556248.1 hypothetical protein [Chitinophaga sedimenti]
MGASKVFSLCGLAPVYKVVAKGNVINPYLDGFLGNWRPVENKVVQTNRQDKNVFDEVTAKGLDIRNSAPIRNSRRSGTAPWANGRAI